MLFSFLMLIALSSGATQIPVHIIDGYTSHQSAFPGDSIELYVNAAVAQQNYRIKLRDLDGKEIASYACYVFPQQVISENAYEDGFGYRVTKKIRIPDVKSGVYLFENKIPIIIKARRPQIIVLYESNTVNAYCNSGGKSLYGFNSSDKVPAQKVSFLRPQPLPQHSEAFHRWLWNQKFQNVGYITDADLDDYNHIKDAKLLIIGGHSEYWTRDARRNFDRFVSEGKHAIILSGNTMWWQVRYNQTRDQLICYRSAKEDPVKNAKLKTIVWNDPTLVYPITSSIGVDFSYAGYGLKKDQGWDGYKILRKSPLLENTSLKENDILPCASDEVDGIPLNEFTNELELKNYSLPGFKKIEVIGYDRVSRGTREGVATWIVFRATASSGIVINTASTDWCSYRGIGYNEDIQIITTNMINKLLRNENVFTDPPEKNTMLN